MYSRIYSAGWNGQTIPTSHTLHMTGCLADTAVRAWNPAGYTQYVSFQQIFGNMCTS
jgi:hypothetical protein